MATANQQKYRAGLHLTDGYSLNFAMQALGTQQLGVVVRYGALSLGFRLPSSAHLDLAIAGV